MTITLSALQKQRYDTAANWTAENPTLLAGEIGVESDTGKIKIGTGSTAWTSLSYSGLIPGSGVYPYSQLLMPSGTVSAPSISFDGDTNLGIYRSGTDQLSFTTAGTERLRIDATGQIEAVSLGTAAAPTFSFTGDPNTGIYSPGADQVAISTNGTERLRITSAGLVGIGISDPGTLLTLGTNAPRLEFNDGDAATDNKRWQFFTGSTSFGLRALTDAGGAGGNQFSFTRSNENINSFQGSAGGTAWFYVDNSTQRVGIGTTSASQKLHIADSSAAFTRYESGSFDAYVGQRSTGILEIAQAQAGNITLLTNGSERVRCDSSGRLLVGTSSTSGVAKLQVQGYVGDNTGVGLVELQAGSATPTSGTGLGRIDFSDNASRRGAVIAAERDGGTWSASSQPGRLVFSTTADGASSPTERMRIDSNGFARYAGAIGRGAPVTKTGAFTVGIAENWLICNGTASITVTLPTASAWTGREIMLKTIAAFTVVSASSNVVPLAGVTAGTAILAATAGRFATLVSDGTNWIIMQAN